MIQNKRFTDLKNYRSGSVKIKVLAGFQFGFSSDSCFKSMCTYNQITSIQ